MLGNLIGQVGGAVVQHVLSSSALNSELNVRELFAVVSKDKGFLDKVESIFEAKKLGEIPQKIFRYRQLKNEKLVDSSELQKLLNNKKRVELKLLAKEIRNGLIALIADNVASQVLHAEEKERDEEDDDLLGEFGKGGSKDELDQQLKDANSAIQEYLKKQDVQFYELTEFEESLPNDLEKKVRKLTLQRSRKLRWIKAQLERLSNAKNNEYPLSKKWCQRELELLNERYNFYFNLAGFFQQLLQGCPEEFKDLKDYLNRLELESAALLQFHRAAIALYPELLKEAPLPLFIGLKGEDLTSEEAKSFWRGTVVSEWKKEWEIELHKRQMSLQKLRFRKEECPDLTDRFDCLIQAERVRIFKQKAIYTRELLIEHPNPGLIRACRQHIQDYKEALNELRNLEEKYKDKEVVTALKQTLFPEAECLFIQKGYRDVAFPWQCLEIRSRIDELLFYPDKFNLEELLLGLPSGRDIETLYKDCIEAKVKIDSSFLSKAAYIPHVWVGLKVFSIGKAVVKDLQGLQKKIRKVRAVNQGRVENNQQLLQHKDLWLECLGDMDEITRVLLELQKKSQLTNDELILKRQLLQASQSFYEFQNKLLEKTLELDSENLYVKRCLLATSQALAKVERDLKTVDTQLDQVFTEQLGVSLSVFEKIGELIGSKNSASMKAFRECLSCKNERVHREKAQLIRELLIEVSLQSRDWSPEKVERAKEAMKKLGEAHKKHLLEHKKASTKLSHTALHLKKTSGDSLEEIQKKLDKAKRDLVQFTGKPSMGGMGGASEQSLVEQNQEKLRQNIRYLQGCLQLKQNEANQAWRKKAAEVIFLQACPLHDEACSILQEEIKVLIDMHSPIGIGVSRFLEQAPSDVVLTRQLVDQPYSPNVVECEEFLNLDELLEQRLKELKRLEKEYLDQIKILRKLSRDSSKFIKHLYQIQTLRLKIEREKASFFKNVYELNKSNKALEAYRKSLQASRKLFNQCKAFSEKAGIRRLPEDHDLMLIEGLKDFAKVAQFPELYKIILQEIDRTSSFFTQIDLKEDLETHQKNAFDARRKFEFLVALKNAGNFNELDEHIKAFQRRYVEQRDKAQKLIEQGSQISLMPAYWLFFEKGAWSEENSNPLLKGVELFISAHNAYKDDDTTSAVQRHGRYLEALKLALEKKCRDRLREEITDLKSILADDIAFLKEEIQRVMPQYTAAYNKVNGKVGVPPQLLQDEIDKLAMCDLTGFHDPVQFLLDAFEKEKSSYLQNVLEIEGQITSDSTISSLEERIKNLKDELYKKCRRYEKIPKEAGAARQFAENLAVFLAELSQIVDSQTVKWIVSKKRPTTEELLETLELDQQINSGLKQLKKYRRDYQEKLAKKNQQLAQLEAAKMALKKAQSEIQKIVAERAKLDEMKKREEEIWESLWNPEKNGENRELFVFGLHSTHLERHWLATKSFGKALSVFQSLFGNNAIIQGQLAQPGKKLLTGLYPTIDHCNRWYRLGYAHGEILYDLLKRAKNSKGLEKTHSFTENSGVFSALCSLVSDSSPVIQPDQIWKLSPHHALKDVSKVESFQTARRNEKEKYTLLGDEEVFVDRKMTVDQALANAKYYNAHLRQLLALLQTKQLLFSALPKDLKEKFESNFADDIQRLDDRFQHILKKHIFAYKMIQEAAQEDENLSKEIFDDSILARLGSSLLPSFFEKAKICTPKAWKDYKKRCDDWVAKGCKQIPKPELGESGKVWFKVAQYTQRQVKSINRNIQALKKREKKLKYKVHQNRHGAKVTERLIQDEKRRVEQFGQEKKVAMSAAFQHRERSKKLETESERLAALTDEKEIAQVYKKRKARFSETIQSLKRLKDEKGRSLKVVERKSKVLQQYYDLDAEIKKKEVEISAVSLALSSQSESSKASISVEELEKLQQERKRKLDELKAKIDPWIKEEKKRNQSEQAQKAFIKDSFETLSKILADQNTKALEQCRETSGRLQGEEEALNAHRLKTPQKYLPEEVVRLKNFSSSELALAEKAEVQAQRFNEQMLAAEKQCEEFTRKNTQFKEGLVKYLEKQANHKETFNDRLRVLKESQAKLNNLNQKVKAAREKLSSAIYQKFTKKLQSEAEEFQQRAGLKSKVIELEEDGTYSEDGFKKALFSYEGDMRLAQCSRDTMWSYRDAHDSLLDIMSVLETLDPENCEEGGFGTTYSSLIEEVGDQLRIYEQAIYQQQAGLESSREKIQEREPYLIRSVGNQLQDRVDQSEEKETNEWELLSITSSRVSKLFGKSKYIVSRYIVHPLVVDPIISGLSAIVKNVKGEEKTVSDDILRATGSWELTDLGALLIRSQGTKDAVKGHLSWDFRSSVAAVLTKKRALEARLNECKAFQRDKIQTELDEVNRLYNFLFIDRILNVLHLTNHRINELKSRGVQESDARLSFLIRDKQLLSSEYKKYFDAYNSLPKPDRSVAGKAFKFLKEFAVNCLFLNNLMQIKYPSAEELKLRKVLADSGKTLSDLLKTVKEQLKVDSWTKFKEAVSDAQSGFLEFSNNYPETAATTVNNFALTVLIVLGKEEFDAFCTAIFTKALFWQYCKAFRGVSDEDYKNKDLTEQEELYVALAKIGPVLPHAASFVRGAAESVEQRGLDLQNNLLDAFKNAMKWRFIQVSTEVIPEDSLRVVDAAVRIVKGDSFKSILRRQTAYEIAGMVKFVHTVMNKPADGLLYARDESLFWLLKIPAAWTIRKWEGALRSLVQVVVPTAATTALVGLPLLASKGVVAGGAMQASMYGGVIFAAAMYFVYCVSSAAKFYTKDTEEKASNMLRGLKKWFQGEEREKSRIKERLQAINDPSSQFDAQQSAVSKEIQKVMSKTISRWTHLGFIEEIVELEMPEEADLDKTVVSIKQSLIDEFHQDQNEAAEAKEDFDLRLARMQEFLENKGSYTSILERLSPEEEEDELTQIEKEYVARRVQQELVDIALRPQLETLLCHELIDQYQNNDTAKQAQEKVLMGIDEDDFKKDDIGNAESFEVAAQNYFKFLMQNNVGESATTGVLTNQLFDGSDPLEG